MGLLGGGGYDADHEAFRDSVRRFVASEVAPHLDDWRAQGGAPAELYLALGEQGFLGVAVPEECGGGGVDDVRFTAVLIEELVAAGALGVAAVVAGHCGVAIPALLGLAPSDRRSEWLAGAADGSVLGVPIALRDGRADSVPGAERAGVFVVLDGADLSVVPSTQVATEPVRVLGCPDAGFGSVTVQTVGASVGGGRIAMARDAGLWGAVTMLAGARAAYRLTTDYVQDRTVFGRPIASFENTVHRMAEIAAEIAAAEALLEVCLDACDDEAAVGRASAAVLVAQQVHSRAVDQGMQLHGGYGYMREYPIAHAFADARQLHLAFASLADPRPVVAELAGL